MASIFAFHSSGDSLAVASPDGRIKVWDTRKREVKFTVEGEMTGGCFCSCLSWNPVSSDEPGGNDSVRKRKRRSHAPLRKNLLAAGTSSGKVLILDSDAGEINRNFDSHQSAVNGAAWAGHQSALYTCSDDHYISKWNADTWEEIARWKGDKGPVTALCCGDEALLLSAGRHIKLWDTDKKEVLKKFTGHANFIRQLQIVPGFNDYFVSRAENERVVNAWSTSLTSSNRNSIASFSCTEAVAHVHVERHPLQKDQVCLAALSTSSSIHVFSHSLNGAGKAPLDPACTIQITSHSSKSNPVPVDIFSIQLVSNGNSLIVVYGSLALPTFEKIVPIQDESHVCLFREIECVVGSKRQSKKRKSSAVTEPSTLVGPAQTVLPGTVPESDLAQIADEVSVEDRLKAVSFLGQVDRDEQPSTESQAQMLVQALYSEDHNLLESVLRVRKPRIIESTIRRLPTTLVIPFIKQLVQRLEKKPARAGELMCWIKTLLLTHSSYLMTVGNLKESLGVLYTLLKSRSILYPQLCLLQGRLDVMVSQLKMQQQGSREEETASFGPLAVFTEELEEEEFSTEADASYELSDGDDSVDDSILAEV